MSYKQIRPGHGWSHAGGAVYDHISGVRVHVFGLCRLPDGTEVRGTIWPEVHNLDRYIAMNGGNRKRGVMAWGLHKMNQTRCWQ